MAERRENTVIITQIVDDGESFADLGEVISSVASAIDNGTIAGKDVKSTMFSVDDAAVSGLIAPPLTVTAQGDTLIYEGEAITVGATATGTIATVQWSVEENPGNVTVAFGAPTALATSVLVTNVSVATALVLRVTVTTTGAVQSSDVMTLTVEPDVPVTVDAGATQAVDEGDLVTLAPTATGNGLTYAWSVVAGSVTLSATDVAAPTFTAPDVSVDSSVVLQLTVTDNRGRTATDQVTIAIADVSDPDFFGETTPIVTPSRTEIQLGFAYYGRGHTHGPLVDMIHYTGNPRVMLGTTVAVETVDMTYNAQGVPLIPTALETADPNHYIDLGKMFAFSEQLPSRPAVNADDVAGTWVYECDANTTIDWQLAPAANWTVISQTSTRIEAKGIPTADAPTLTIRPYITSSNASSAQPTLIRTKFADDSPTGNVARHAAGYICRQEFVEQAWGADYVRVMNNSGAIGDNALVVRFDQVADVSDLGWFCIGSPFPYKFNPFAPTAAPSYDVVDGSGVPGVYFPYEARVRMAYELGSSPHITLPPYLFENAENYDPVVLGPSAEEWWADGSLTDSQREAFLNDTELQHIDAFAAKMLTLRNVLVDNKCKIEVGNEGWSTAQPYSTFRDYALRAFPFVSASMGRSTASPAGTDMSMVHHGYLVTKAIARLRKQAPAIQWVGVMAGFLTDIVPNSPFTAGPTVDGGFYNRTLFSLAEGYRLFWEDFNNNPNWATLYAPEPAALGHWFHFSVSGYHYLQGFPVEAGNVPVDQADSLNGNKTVIAAMAPATLEATSADSALWQLMWQDWIEWNFDGTVQAGQYGALSTAADLRRRFRAAVETAAHYGARCEQYEGGGHMTLGQHYSDKIGEWPSMLPPMWQAFQESTEMALLNAQARDIALDPGATKGGAPIPGFVGLSHFTVFQASADGSYTGGLRRSFADHSPSWIEITRLFDATKSPPPGTTGLVSWATTYPNGQAYFDAAAANDYYHDGAFTIPTPNALLQLDGAGGTPGDPPTGVYGFSDTFDADLGLWQKADPDRTSIVAWDAGGGDGRMALGYVSSTDRGTALRQFNVEAGKSYTVELTNTGTVHCFIGTSVFDATYANQLNLTAGTQSFTIAADATTTLFFTLVNRNTQTEYVDDISVTEIV